jgi:hypothetical protein
MSSNYFQIDWIRVVASEILNVCYHRSATYIKEKGGGDCGFLWHFIRHVFF